VASTAGGTFISSTLTFKSVALRTAVATGLSVTASSVLANILHLGGHSLTPATFAKKEAGSGAEAAARKTLPGYKFLAWRCRTAAALARAVEAAAANISPSLPSARCAAAASNEKWAVAGGGRRDFLVSVGRKMDVKRRACLLHHLHAYAAPYWRGSTLCY